MDQINSAVPSEAHVPTPPYSEAWLAGPAGHRFYTRTYAPPSPPKATVVFVHGFADHVGRYEHVHAAWLRRGIAVFAYDLRGFGRTALDEKHRSPGASFGKTSGVHEAEDLAWWLRYVGETWPGIPIFLMGHSMGAAVVMAFVSRQGTPKSNPETQIATISGVLLNAPLLELTYPRPSIVRFAAGAAARLFPNLRFTVGLPEDWFSRDTSMCKALAEDPLRKRYGRLRGLLDMLNRGEELLREGWKHWPKDVPVIQTWGTADKVNSMQAGVLFHERLPIKDKNIIFYESAYHELFHEIDGIPGQVTEQLVSWVEERIHRAQA